MNYTGKPTHHNGIDFRSKLEAQWACFFEYTGWEYNYEPFEINGRLPDFIIKCKNKNYPTIKQLIVEVKPEIFCTEDYMKSVQDSYIDYPAHLLFLTENPFTSAGWGPNIMIGMGREWYYDKPSWLSEIFMKDHNDISSQDAMWDGWIYGEIERKTFVEYDDYAYYFQDLFKRAANNVQFKSY